MYLCNPLAMYCTAVNSARMYSYSELVQRYICVTGHK